MLDKARKRFYKEVSTKLEDGQYVIFLDGRAPKTPAGKKIAVPFQALAEALVLEWDAQQETIKPHTMPLTQLVSTALDRVGPERPVITEQLMAYAKTELLCYRAQHPHDLILRQQELWDPLLDWAAQELGARLKVTSGIMAVDQPAAALAAFEVYLNQLDLWRLTVLQMTCAASGSIVLASALVRGRINAEQCFDLSALDENFQIERWGEDYEAKDRRDRLREDMNGAYALLGLIETAH